VEQQEVIDFYNMMGRCGIPVWIDGGWGVDALLGRQTGPHKDLDIAIQQQHVQKLRDLLEEQGYKEVKLEDAQPHNFVLGDDRGREIDVHVVVLDDNGNGIYGPPQNGEMYPAAALTGVGQIGGCPVRCISPEWAMNFHSGYDLKEKDYHDVAALCEEFGFDLPQQFLKWVK